jgi:Helix-hairpin-helix motif
LRSSPAIRARLPVKSVCDSESRGCSALFRNIVLAGSLTVACAGSLLFASPSLPAKRRDSTDLAAVKAVCGRCHTIDMFAHAPRSQDEWVQVYQKMSRLGAKGTDEQIGRVIRYMQQTLTLVNINMSSAEEIGPVLSVSDDVAADIVARRQRQRFAGISDLSEVPGVDPKILEQRSARIRF